MCQLPGAAHRPGLRIGPWTGPGRGLRVGRGRGRGRGRGGMGVVSEWGHGQGWWRLGGHCGLLEGALTIQGCPAAPGIHHRERPGRVSPALSTGWTLLHGSIAQSSVLLELVPTLDGCLTPRTPDLPAEPSFHGPRVRLTRHPRQTPWQQGAGRLRARPSARWPLVAVTLRLHILSGQAAGLCPCR